MDNTSNSGCWFSKNLKTWRNKKKKERRKRDNPIMVNSIPRQNIRQCQDFFSSFLMQVSHFSKRRPNTNPVPFQACYVILRDITRKHIYLSPFLPLCSLSAHRPLTSPQFCPYLMQLLSPARTVLTHWNWIAGGAFHFQHLNDLRFGFNLSGHQSISMDFKWTKMEISHNCALPLLSPWAVNRR